MPLRWWGLLVEQSSTLRPLPPFPYQALDLVDHLLSHLLPLVGWVTHLLLLQLHFPMWHPIFPLLLPSDPSIMPLPHLPALGSSQCLGTSPPPMLWGKAWVDYPLAPIKALAWLPHPTPSLQSLPQLLLLQ